jgi:hypothetical protein
MEEHTDDVHQEKGQRLSMAKITQRIDEQHQCHHTSQEVDLTGHTSRGHKDAKHQWDILLYLDAKTYQKRIDDAGIDEQENSKR